MFYFILLLFFFPILSPAQQNEEEVDHVIYEFNWAGLSDSTNCAYSIDVEDFNRVLNKKIRSHKVAVESGISNATPIHYFLDDYQRWTNGEVVRQKAVLPFLICDQEIITIRIYIFDFTLGQLSNETALTLNGKNAANFIDLTLDWALSTGLSQDARKGHNTEFLQCIYRPRMDYLYSLYLHMKDSIEHWTFGQNHSNYNVNEIIDGLKHYLRSLNYEYCGDLRSILEKDEPVPKTSKLRNLREQYPNLIRLMSHIDIYEDYQIRNFAQRRGMEGALISSNKELVNQAEQLIPRKERKRYFSKVPHYKIVNRLSRALELVDGCDSLFGIAEQYELKREFNRAEAIYFELLKNQDINKFLLKAAEETDHENKICGSLKEYSWINLDKIRRAKKIIYINHLRFADSLFYTQNYKDALSFYFKADSLNSGLSVCVERKIFRCTRKLNEQKKANDLDIVRNGIISILGQKFDCPTASVTAGSSKTFELEKDRVCLILEKDTTVVDKSTSLFIDRNYSPDSFVPNFESFDNHLVEGIRDIYVKYKAYIQRIEIRYYGSSDTSSQVDFQLSELEAIFGSSIKTDTVYFGAINQSIRLRDLIKGRYQGQFGNNLLLAALRAFYKEQQNYSKLIWLVPESLIKTKVFAHVFPKRGGIYREVKTEVIIKLKYAQKVGKQLTNNQLFDYDSPSLLELSKSSFSNLRAHLLVSAFSYQFTRNYGAFLEGYEHFSLEGTNFIPIDNWDDDDDGIRNSKDKCPRRKGPMSNNGCPTTFKGRRELGVNMGVVSYSGDLSNGLFSSNDFNPLAGVSFRQFLDKGIAFRGDVNFGAISGDLRNIQDWVVENNVDGTASFKKSIKETSLSVEIHSSKEPKYAANGQFIREAAFYSSLGISTIFIDGETQFSENNPLNSAVKSSFTAVAVPVSAGVKGDLSEKMNLELRIGYTFTFSDDLDEIRIPELSRGLRWTNDNLFIVSFSLYHKL